MPVLTRIDDDIDDLEQDVIDNADAEDLQRIFSLKRDLVAMRRVVTPMRDMFARNADGSPSCRGWTPTTGSTSVTCTTGWSAISDLVDSYRDLLSRRDRHVPLDRGQPPGRDQQAADDHRHDLPPAHLPDRLLRPELRAGWCARSELEWVVLRVRPRAAVRVGGRLLDLLPRWSGSSAAAGATRAATGCPGWCMYRPPAGARHRAGAGLLGIQPRGAGGAPYAGCPAACGPAPQIWSDGRGSRLLRRGAAAASRGRSPGAGSGRCPRRAAGSWRRASASRPCTP